MILLLLGNQVFVRLQQINPPWTHALFLPLKNKPHPQRAQTHTLSLDLRKGWSLQLYLPSLCHLCNLANKSLF